MPGTHSLKRGLTFNPDRVWSGARRITSAGTFAYVLTDKALVVVDLDNPLAPKVTATIAAPVLHDPRALAVQFRYAFVVDRDGLKVLDVTNLAQPKIVLNALVPFEDARNDYGAPPYAYVSAGKQEMAVVVVEKPDAPKLHQMFTSNWHLNDVNPSNSAMLPPH